MKTSALLLDGRFRRPPVLAALGAAVALWSTALGPADLAAQSVISSAGVRRGPIGQKVSKDLPRKNCPPAPSFCHHRAETSLAQQ